jgi:hypothetical protein
MSAFQTFGDAISSLQIDKTQLPNSTVELVTNILDNIKTNKPQENYNQPSSSPQQSPTPTKTITSISVWNLIKMSLILSIFFTLLSTEFIKSNITKLTNKPFLTTTILFFTFLMVSFVTIKWFS